MINRTNLRFKALPAEAPSLFPEDIFNKIPSDHPVRLVDMVVNNLDIDNFLAMYKGGGAPGFHPRMMIKVLFYAYLSNIYSCRKIEKALHENIFFMWIAGNSTPDFRTINHFRSTRLKEHIKDLFADIVRILQRLGYVSLQMQYIDGTKIESASGRYTFVWRKNVERNKERLEAKIESVLSDIESQIREDQQEANKTETPRKIDSAELKKKLSELNTTLRQSDKQTKKQLQKLQTEHLPRLEKYEQQLEILDGRNSYSKTDTDATFMRLKEDHLQTGQLKPAYNAQISTEEQFVTNYSLHQTAGDTTTLEKHLDSFEESYQMQSTEVIADAGYGSEENYEMMEGKNIDAYVKYNYYDKEKTRGHRHNPFLSSNLYYNTEKDYFVCPMGQHMERKDESRKISQNGYESAITHYEAKNCKGCPLRGMCHDSEGNRRISINHRLNELRAKARNMLDSELGKAHRIKRSIEPESVFGQLKWNNGFKRFTLRGLDKVAIEMGLMLIGHNLRKLVKSAPSNGKTPESSNCKRTFGTFNTSSTTVGHSARIFRMNSKLNSAA